MAFYHPRCIDPAGGFFHCFLDDGGIHDRSRRHLVSSSRFVFNYAMAAIEFRDAEYLEVTRHGLAYLRDVHRDAAGGGYAWTLRDGQPDDRNHYAYGTAFVLLAYASALRAGIGEAKAWIDETWDLLESRYWDACAGLYRDEADADWNFSDYRGQNANMHLCEALIAAHEASGDARYLDRAFVVADHITRRQAGLAGGLVWEHYDADWAVDWGYHKDDPKHLFKPWGFQPGHLVEWTKLLLTLDRLRPTDWLLPTARHLYDNALAQAEDTDDGGLFYGFAPDGRICDDDKVFWVQAEAIAAAALLASRTGDDACWHDYQRLWDYAWTHFVDHQHGAWFHILDRHNRAYSDEKSPAGKTDYHTMGACHDILALLRRRPELAAPVDDEAAVSSGAVIGLR